MTYKTLLAVLQSEDDAHRVLDFAIPLAARHSSHLIGLHAEALPMVYATPMGGPVVDFSMASEEAMETRLQQMRALFTSRVEQEDIAFEWRGMENISGDSCLSARESARSADLVIAQQINPEAPSRAVGNVEILLFETGRPVLFVPYSIAQPRPEFKKVLLAWNGSREASRAAFDALPFMKEAESVEVLSVDPKDSYKQDASVAGAEIAAALARHGVKVTYSSEESGGMSHAEVIENRVSDTDADLLVMGAYGGSRLKEFFFGGVTRTILESMPIPTFMSR
ncbi:nucleotide-binding universal stress UspA family protein [Mesorhizobium sp. J18]|uniref:universal stress protein n=1 Tax=Mesorhizobium sp. J18 TaxID=935263 RepID=UPI00119C0B52|nr:universal stress protein [Mesorhizobium sp. J18]TWG94165.1 nucleotide-binding universal stress UspA family protein [Mesorhizobium sp. J18]